MAQKISKKFSFVGENIKKIRQAKKISQADFAKLFNLARPSVGAYEEGRSEPKIDTLIQIAKHFRISIDVLLTRKLSVAEIYSFDKVNKQLDKVHSRKAQEDNIVQSAALIPAHSFVEYIVQHESRDYINSCKQVGIPVELTGFYRVFEMRGPEMYYQYQGLRNGDLLIARKTSIQSSKKSIGDLFVVVAESDIVIRRLQQVHKNTMSLAPDDPHYENIELTHSSIVEIWQVIGVYHSRLVPPTRTEERLSRIEEELNKLRGHLK